MSVITGTRAPAETASTTPSTTPSAVWLTAYVDRPFLAVLEQFRNNRTDQLLTATGCAAIGGGGRVQAQADPPIVESSGHALVPLTWTLVWQNGHVERGAGTLSILVVRTGAQPVTELLIAVPFTEATRAKVIDVSRKLLDLLAARLEAAIPA